MKKRLLTYGNHFCAVEHATEQNFHLLQLQKKKKELVLSKQESYTNFNDVVVSVGIQKHIFLIVNNEQILSKEIAFTHSSKERIVKTAFPNIQLQDFYFEVSQNDTLSMVSICRKEVINTLLQEYVEKGISVINFSLGNLKINTLTSFTELPQIQTSNAIISLENNQVTQLEKKKGTAQTYDINGLEVNNNQVLALSGIISYYSGKEFLSDDEFQNSLLTAYQQKRIFTLGIRSALGILFFALLVNFLLFTNYRESVATLTSELALNETYKKQLINLKELVSKKDKLLESIHSASNSKVIWVVNEISKSVPTSLSLSEIKYQPLTRPAREEKQIELREDEILIKGTSKDDIDFTHWISELEKQSWINKVSSLNYGSGKTKQTSFDFIIQMNRK